MGPANETSANKPSAFTFRRGIKLAVFVLAAILFIAAVFRLSAEPTTTAPKIGFVILGDIRNPGWNASHYEGVRAACDARGAELLVRDHVRENAGECPAAVRELAEKGCGLILLASFGYPAEIRDLVGKYPDVAFAATSSEAYSANMTAYFVRLYQARYLAGALAGMRTKSGVIGYVAAMPNAEVNRGINAFTLGAQRINPDVKVVVAWTGEWENPKKEAALTERLIREKGADLITYHQDDAAAAETADRLGVDFIAYNAPIPEGLTHGLASIRCRWDIYYDDILRRYLKGELNAVKNHWIGVERDAVELTEFSPEVTEEMRTKLDAFRHEFLYQNQKLIFTGPIYDNQGVLRCDDGETISDDTLLGKIDWQIRGVTNLD